MEIPQNSYNALVRRLPDLIRHTLGDHTLQVVLQEHATLVTAQGRRNISRSECNALAATHARQVLAKAKRGAPFTLFELPIMENGVFMVKGQERIVMLKKNLWHLEGSS